MWNYFTVGAVLFFSVIGVFGVHRRIVIHSLVAILIFVNEAAKLGVIEEGVFHDRKGKVG